MPVACAVRLLGSVLMVVLINTAIVSMTFVSWEAWRSLTRGQNPTLGVSELGLEKYVDKFKAIVVDTLGSLAYATDYVPGSGAPELFQKEFVEPIFGKKSSLRRLFVEAYTLASAELKRKTEPRQEDVVWTLPIVC